MAEVGESSRARICCKVSVGVRGVTASGRITRWGVAVADDLQVKMVRMSATGEHGVELLTGFLAGEQAVHGVGGEALGAVDGGGVAEPGRGVDVVGGQPGSEPAPLVPDGQLPVFADLADRPRGHRS